MVGLLKCLMEESNKQFYNRLCQTDRYIHLVDRHVKYRISKTRKLRVVMLDK